MQFITFFHYSLYANQDGIKENIFYFKKAILIFFQVLNFPGEKKSLYYVCNTLVALLALNKVLIKKLEFSKVITVMTE